MLVVYCQLPSMSSVPFEAIERRVGTQAKMQAS